ncbi:hypothetical protein LSUE1_G002107 [Lachnellula suecica]|uniref:Phytanoyl-CoA dioxygenase n=1 Tax=Lachnellula suecica TaxID=602035 RepID=A0A8T9CEA2_9HELO|nr:hypothetical protein LSUE1_G002107 [Lachnellula suecica]
MGSVDTQEDYTLTEEQKTHFMEHGYIKIPRCFSRTQAEDFTSNLWTRLGMSPTDKSTWTTERTNMPWHSHVSVQEFAPRAWGAMCELLGGQERIEKGGWSDGFIVNLGREADEGKVIREGTERGEDLRALDGWHSDGESVNPFNIDSPEQALLVIPLWSDISPGGGGTAIASDSIKHIAHHLYSHPEGLAPWMRPLTDPTEDRAFWTNLAHDTSKISSSSIIEATGEVGDVYLLHPLMLHSASRNLLRVPRVITNPPKLEAMRKAEVERLKGV